MGYIVPPPPAPYLPMSNEPNPDDWGKPKRKREDVNVLGDTRFADLILAPSDDGDDALVYLSDEPKRKRREPPFERPIPIPGDKVKR